MKPQFELITEREVLESMTPPQLAQHALMLGQLVTKIEIAMSLVSEVLEGYGTTVEQQLDSMPQVE